MADPEDLLLTLLTTKRLMTEELIIARNADTIAMAGAVAEAAAESSEERDLVVPLRAEVQSRIDKGTGRDTARYKDMHLQVEGDGILPQCPHLLTSDVR